MVILKQKTILKAARVVGIVEFNTAYNRDISLNWTRLLFSADPKMFNLYLTVPAI